MRRPRWLQRQPPPPDTYSFSLALTALRQTSGAAIGTALVPDDATDDEAGRRDDATTAERAGALLADAVARGLVPADAPPPAAVAHALVCACGADVALATALWKGHLRPKALAARQADAPLAYAAPGQPPTSEQASYHALLRVCGLAGRADEALRIVYAIRRDGLPADSACYSSYVRGKAAAAEHPAVGGTPGRMAARAKGLLQSGYEQLLSTPADCF